MANEIANRLISDLMADFGLTREQAAGVAGNFAHETLNFTRMQERGTNRGGLGYAQWTGARRTDFENWATEHGLDTSSYEANYGYLKHELETDPYERRQFMRVTNARTAEEAARIVSDEFLRPGTPHLDRRIDLANQFAGPSAPREAPTPATPSLPLQSARLAQQATNPELQSALNARVNAPPMPRPRPDRPQANAANLADQIAMSPISGGRQSAPMFDAAYDTRTGTMRLTREPIDSQGIAVGASRPPAPPMPIGVAQSYAGQERVGGVSPAQQQAMLPPLPPPRVQAAQAPVPASVEDRVTARNAVLAQAGGVGQPPSTRVVQSVPMPASFSPPSAQASNGSASDRVRAAQRAAAPVPQSRPVTEYEIASAPGTTIASIPTKMANAAPKPSSGSASDRVRAAQRAAQKPATVLPTQQQLVAATGFTGPLGLPERLPETPAHPPALYGSLQPQQVAQIGAGVPMPGVPSARPPNQVASAKVPPVPMPASSRPVGVASMLDVVPPVPLAQPPGTLAPSAPRSGGIAPVPMPRLERPGLPVPGIIGDITRRMANAGGPFDNGADNLIYNVMRGGNFDTPGAATHISKSGYLFAPSESGGWMNVGRADRSLSPAQTYERANARAAERARRNASKSDRGNESGGYAYDRLTGNWI